MKVFRKKLATFQNSSYICTVKHSTSTDEVFGCAACEGGFFRLSTLP